MNEQLCIFVCNSLEAEVNYVLQTGNYTDVKLLSFPTNCVGSPLNYEKISFLTSQIKDQYTKIIFFASTCQSKSIEEIPKDQRIEVVELSHCTELILNKDIIYNFIKQGYYLITNGFLKNYQKHFVECGFNEQSARTFFKESFSKILLLDTGLPGDFMPNLISFSDYTGLYYDTFPVGLSHCQFFLETEISRWREEIRLKNINETPSGYSKISTEFEIIINQLLKLADLNEESLIIDKVLELLNLIFTPHQIKYQKIHNKVEGNITWLNNNIIDLKKNQNDYFVIEIIYQNEILGIIEIYGMKYPENIEFYKKIEHIFSNICGVLIANFRKQLIILDKNEQLKKFSNQLNEQIQIKNKFISIISKDLRGPLRGFMKLTDLLTDESDFYTPNQKKNITSSLSQSAGNILNLLDNLHKWSQYQGGLIDFKPQIHIIKDVVDECIKIVSDLAKIKEIEIIVNINDKLEVFADKDMFQSIIRNLIENAIKFSLSSTSIDISAINNENNELEVKIKDTGIGMNNEILSNLFKLNSSIIRTGTSGEKGTGLGLTLCKAFVEKHGGKLYAESNPGKGSVFYLTLPYNFEISDDIVIKKVVSTDGETKQFKDLKILIAEDDETSEILISMSVEIISKEILKAVNGIEVVEICRSNPDIDLILMDIKMPEMDGYEATRIIRQFNKDVIIIAQTAFYSSEEKQKARDAGCNDYISKPIIEKDLFKLIEKHLNSNKEKGTINIKHSITKSMNSKVFNKKKFNKALIQLNSLNHPKRLEIINMLIDTPKMNVTQIFLKLKIEQATVSHHLGLLRTNGILNSNREGQAIYYSINQENFENILNFIERFDP